MLCSFGIKNFSYYLQVQMQSSAYEACGRTHTPPHTPKMSKACNNKPHAIICKKGNEACGISHASCAIYIFVITVRYISLLYIFVNTVSSFLINFFTNESSLSLCRPSKLDYFANKTM